jgi:hypothetical protein
MNYAKVKDNAVEVYPYSFKQLKIDNKNTSFPKDFFQRDDILSDFNVVKVVSTEKPSKSGWLPREEAPSFSNGVWSQNWELIPKEASSVDPSEIEDTEPPVQEGYRVEHALPELVDGVWKQKWILVENTWLENREASYGKAEQQLEFITENGIEAWQAKVAEIKAKYPKS